MECKDFSIQADEVMTPNNAKVEIVNVGGQRVMKISAKLGWKWSAILTVQDDRLPISAG